MAKEDVQIPLAIDVKCQVNILRSLDLILLWCAMITHKIYQQDIVESQHLMHQKENKLVFILKKIGIYGNQISPTCI